MVALRSLTTEQWGFPVGFFVYYSQVVLFLEGKDLLLEGC
jgi:hypothetical protein